MLYKKKISMIHWVIFRKNAEGGRGGGIISVLFIDYYRKIITAVKPV